MFRVIPTPRLCHNAYEYAPAMQILLHFLYQRRVKLCDCGGLANSSLSSSHFTLASPPLPTSRLDLLIFRSFSPLTTRREPSTGGLTSGGLCRRLRISPPSLRRERLQPRWPHASPCSPIRSTSRPCRAGAQPSGPSTRWQRPFQRLRPSSYGAPQFSPPGRLLSQMLTPDAAAAPWPRKTYPSS